MQAALRQRMVRLASSMRVLDGADGAAPCAPSAETCETWRDECAELVGAACSCADENLAELLIGLVLGGFGPQAMEENRAHLKQALCGRGWAEQTLAYRCMTCGTSPSSALCGACFLAGNHEGHTWRRYKSGASEFASRAACLK